MAGLTDEQARLLEEPNFATVGTLNRDGSAQLSIVWIDWDGKDVLFNTAAGRTKPRNLERDPRVSVLVVGADGYRWVAVRGAAEMTTERAGHACAGDAGRAREQACGHRAAADRGRQLRP